MKISPLTNLDYESIKTDLKLFLKDNTTFSDYDYNGSNITQLINLLAYNTFLSQFQLNLALNELSLETATLRDNVTAKANELGYTPNNYSSALLDLPLTFTVPAGAKFVEIPSGIMFVGTKSTDNIGYTFNNVDRKILPATNGNVTTTLTLSEGVLLTNSYIYGEEDADRIILFNDKIDINTIRVTSNGINYTKFDRNNATDTTFYVSLIQDQNIEIQFGGNILGKSPNIGDTVTVSYLTNNGSNGNNINQGTFVGNIKYYFDNNAIGIIVPLGDITVGTIAVSSGGTDSQPLKQIKFNARNLYTAQDRAVVASDYQALLIEHFPFINSVMVIGGETLVPPRYGHVKLIIQNKDGNKLNQVQKNNILQFLKRYNLTNIIIIEDAKYTKLKIRSYIKYDLKKLPTYIDKLIEKISTAINDYVATEDFANGFYGNRLESIIYNLDKSILSAKIKLVLVDELSSNNGNYKGNIGNKIKSDNCKLFSLMSKSYNQNGTNYRIVSVGDSGIVEKQKYTSDGDVYSWNMDSNVGTIDPKTGEFDLNVDTNDLTIVTIPDTLDIDNTGGILVPVVLPPVVSVDDIVIIDDISIEEEVVDPVVIDVVTPIDTVVISDIIPILSNIVC
jgi:RNA binding exosome subunit